MPSDVITFLDDGDDFLELTSNKKGIWAVTGDCARVVVAISEQLGPVVATVRRAEITTVASGRPLTMGDGVWRVGEWASLTMVSEGMLDIWDIGEVSRIQLIA